MKRRAIVIGSFILLVWNVALFAHCDSVKGPVVADAAEALKIGKIDPVMKWVAADDEAQVRASFSQTMSVRRLSNEARQLADHYFFETVVRLHRASEGEPYTGLKEEAPAPILQLADAALESHDLKKLESALFGHLRETLQTLFATAGELRRHASHDAEAGRRFVAAYARYMHFVEAAHAATEHHPAAVEDPHHRP